MSIVVLYQNSYINVIIKNTLYEHFMACVASHNYAFLNILRSFRACIDVCVFVHAYESGRNKTHACLCVFIILTF